MHAPDPTARTDERRAVGANEIGSLDLPSQPGRVQRLAAPESHEMGDEIRDLKGVGGGEKKERRASKSASPFGGEEEESSVTKVRAVELIVSVVPNTQPSASSKTIISSAAMTFRIRYDTQPTGIVELQY